MEITLDKKSKTEGLIKIKLTEGDYQHKVEEKMKDYARKASLKGFRPGKVPAGIIRKMFGKSIMVDEINDLVNNKLSSYIKENNLKILGDPLPDREKAGTIDWDNQKDFEFEYQIGMVEEFSFELSQKTKVTNYTITLDEKVVDESITDLRKRFGKAIYPEVSEPGDSLFGKLTSPDDGWSREGAMIEIDKVSKTEQKAFIGVKKEDIIPFDIAKLFTDVSSANELLDGEREPNGQYSLQVQTITRVEPAAIASDLFDRVFGREVTKTEEEFRQKIRDTIDENYKRETNHFFEHNVEDALVKNTKITMPENFLKTWLKTTDDKNQITEEVLNKEFDAYIRNLKWDLIRNKIAEENKINVETEEIRARSKELIISQFGGPAFAEQIQDKLEGIVENYLSHENGKNFMRLYTQIRNEKIFSYIKEHITTVEKSVTLDEFREIVKEHKH